MKRTPGNPRRIRPIGILPLSRGSRPPRMAALAGAGPAKRTKCETLEFDASITATPRELREQGYTWRAIGELLGISLHAAYRAAHSKTQRKPHDLRQQARARYGGSPDDAA